MFNQFSISRYYEVPLVAGTATRLVPLTVLGGMHVPCHTDVTLNWLVSSSPNPVEGRHVPKKEIVRCTV